MMERYNTDMKIIKKQTYEGFSLAEMILVITLTVFLMVVTVQSFGNSTTQFAFGNDNEKVLTMINFARSLAISGKAQLDYTDYNKDGCKDTVVLPACSEADYVTPANYGVNFNTTTNTVTLFADTHTGSDPADKEGKFDPCTGAVDYSKGCDIILDTYTLTASQLVLFPPAITPAVTSATVFYSPIFADITFDQTLPKDPFFTFELLQSGNTPRTRCVQIHKVAGIPEPLTCP